MPGADHIILTESNKSTTTTNSSSDKDSKPAVAVTTSTTNGGGGGSQDTTFQQQQQQQVPVVILSQGTLRKQAVGIQKQAAEGLMSLLRAMGSAYRLLSRYKCVASVEAFQSLPPHHTDTPFVLRCIAKAYFHCSDYQASARYVRHGNKNTVC